MTDSSSVLVDLLGLHSPFGTYTATSAEAIYAGQWVVPQGTTVASTTSTSTAYYKTKASSLVTVGIANANTDEAIVCGMALESVSAASLTLAVATKGIFLVQANAAISVGQMVSMIDGSASQKLAPAVAGSRQLGIALTKTTAQNDYFVLLCTGLGPTGAEA